MKLKWEIRQKIIHLLFWVLITMVFLYDRSYLIQKIGLGHFAACIAVRLILIISLSYLHIFYLIPHYFGAKRYGRYFILLAASLCIYVALQSLYDIYLYGVVIGVVHYRNFWYSFPLNFITTAWYLSITIAFKLSIDWYHQRNEIRGLRDELEKDTSNALNTMAEDHSHEAYVYLKSGVKKIKTFLDSVYYIQGLKDYSIVYTEADKIIIKGSLKMVEELFPANYLIRIHKSYLVANNKIKALQSDKLILANNKTLPIGRSYKNKIEPGK